MISIRPMHKIHKSIKGRTAAIAIGCGLVLGSVGPVFSASTPQAQSTLDVPFSRSSEQRRWDGFVGLLQAIQARAFAHVLEKEQKSQSTDRMPASTPIPTCVFEHGLCGALNKDGSIAVHPR